MTRFEYASHSLTPTQEKYIQKNWMWLAASAWAYYLETGQQPLIGINENSPQTLGVCSLDEARGLLERDNPQLTLNGTLDDYRVSDGVLLMWYRGNYATDVAVLHCPQLTPPRAYNLWRAFTHEKQQWLN